MKSAWFMFFLLQAALCKAAKGSDVKLILEINLRVVFPGEQLIMKCLGCDRQQDYRTPYLWYKDNSFMTYTYTSEFTIKKVKSSDEATYHCEMKNDYCRGVSQSVNVIVPVGRNVILQINLLSVWEGDSLQLTCRCKRCYGRKRFKFHKDGKSIKDLRINKNSVTYRIQSAHLEDVGSYSCTYEKSTSNQVDVNVRERFSKPVLRVEQEGEIFVSQPLAITCHVEKFDPGVRLTYIFYKDFKTLQDHSEINYWNVGSALMDDSGTYSCAVLSMWRSLRKESNVVAITVKQIFSTPTLSAKPETQVREGQMLKLLCQVEIFQAFPLRRTFYKGGNVLKLSDAETYLIESVSWPHDSGVYQCEAAVRSRGVKKMSNEIVISVQGTPVSKPLLTIKPTMELLEGDKLLLICSVSNGSSPLTYIFYKDAQKELYREESNLTEVPFEMGNVNKSWEGKYSCAVGNKVSELRLKSELVEVTIIEQSRAATIIISLLSPLLAVVLIGLYFFWRRRNKQSDSSRVLQPTGMVTGTGSQTYNEPTASNDNEYANVGTAWTLETTQHDNHVVYSEVRIKKRNNIDHGREVSGGNWRKEMPPIDYSIAYSQVNFVKTGANLPRAEMEDVDLYENIARN
ncbi:Fc receptor-like protein 2 isoform X4 [Narcine bancroftii]|uniref:Fc receptor-like protein 2 isoform X4 n=1 Tax=Narcine bancroftii TaxID=1343680 RepID=UPI0038322255